MKEIAVFGGQDEYSGFVGFWKGWCEIYKLDIGKDSIPKCMI